MFPRVQFKIRHTLAAIPAMIFWVVSAIFFIMGLSLHDQTGYLLYIAIGLAVANTIVQFIGWDSDPNELGPILFWSWIASYLLGIGTNMVALISILQIQNTFLEWIVSGALSFLIEVTPERLFVLAWRSISPKPGNTGRGFQGGEDRRDHRTRQEHRGHQELGQTPEGMTRQEYLKRLAQKQQEAQQRAAQKGQGQKGQQNQPQKVQASQAPVQASMFRPEDLQEDDDDDGMIFFQ